MTAREAEIIELIRKEVKPALGCTEPIAVALAVAKAMEIIEEKYALEATWRMGKDYGLRVEVSGNILKNVKSVVVPHTGGMRGIPAAVAAGIVAGKPQLELEVISGTSEEEIREIAHYLNSTPITVHFADTPHIFDIMITLSYKDESSFVRITSLSRASSVGAV